MTKKRHAKHTAPKKRPTKAPWWRSGRNWVSVGLTGGLVVAVVGVVVWVALGIVGGGDSAPPVYLSEPAPPFTLPTTAGEEVTLADHSGQHNVLLFFNEGMG